MAIARGLVAVVRASVVSDATMGVSFTVPAEGFSDGARAGGGVATERCVLGGSTVAGADGLSVFPLGGVMEEPCDSTP